MRIALVGPAHPLRGGIADFQESLARTFSEKGHEVKLFSFSYQYPSILFPGKSQKREGEAPKDLSIDSIIHSVWPPNWFSSAMSIAAFKPDLVIMRYWMPFMAPSLGTIAGRLRRKNIPVIVLADNVIPHEKFPFQDQLNSFLLKKASGFMVMSRAVQNDLERYVTNPKVRCLPHPIYSIFGEKLDKAQARSQIKIPEKENWILFFGFIRKYKGLHLLIDAMAEHEVKELGIKCLVAGEFYDDPKPYKEKVKALGLEDRIRFDEEFIPTEVVKSYFSACDLVVQPYITATQSGISQIAYQFDTPMVVTNVGGLGEWIPESVGYVVDPSAKAVAQSIADFFKRNRSKEMSIAAAQEKKRFDWTYFAEEILDLGQELNPK